MSVSVDHSHNVWFSGSGADIGNMSTSSGTTSSQSTSSGTTSSTGSTETRPMNYAIKIWKRTA